MVVTSIFLFISLSNQSYESFNRRYQLMEIYTSTETKVLRDQIRELFERIGPKLERLEINHIENIDKQFIVQVISF